MSGECPAARDLAERMAGEYLSACGASVSLEDREALAQMLLPAAEVVTEAWALAQEMSARLDAQAAVLADLALRAAEDGGELDMPAALADGYGYTGGRARKEAPGG